MVLVTIVVLASVLAANAQLGCQDLTATVSGRFREANSNQFYTTTLDLVSEYLQPTGAWELVTDEEYEFEVTLDDNQGDHVGRVTILDPEGEIIDEATADPPASTLTASGSFTAGQLYALRYVLEAKLVCKPGDEPSVEVVWKWVADPPPDPPPAEPPTKLEVAILDMTEGAPGIPIPSFVVEIWPEGHQELNRWKTTNMQGVAVFSGIDPGEWVVHVVGIGATGACHYEFDSMLVLHETNVETLSFWRHGEINGKVWFKDDQGQVVGGNPAGVTISLVRGGVLVDMVGYVVNPTANPEGSYPYQVYRQEASLVADNYVVRGSYEGTTVDEDVTYPNHCSTALPAPFFTHLTPGAHQAVAGPDLVFIVDE